MFRGIITIFSTLTLFRSWPVTLGSVLLVLLWLFLVKNSAKELIGRYLCGCVVGIGVWMFFDFQRSNSSRPVPTIISGTVVTQLKADTYELDTTTGRWYLKTKKPLDVGAEISLQGNITEASAPVVSRTGAMRPLFFDEGFSFSRRLAMKRYRGAVSSYENQLIQTGTGTLGFVSTRRVGVKERIFELFPDPKTRALLLGMSIGDRSGFDPATYTSFVRSGLVHLLAVSGANITYVAIFLGIVFFWCPFYLRMVIVGIGILGYGLLCGPDSSVLRAVAMGLLGLVATRRGRPVQTRRLLQIVAGGMLLWNPLLLRYDLGFLLSFSAVSGIVMVSHRYTEFLSTHLHSTYSKALQFLLVPTIGATLGVFPVLILFSGQISLTTIPLNMLIVPLVPVFLLSSVLATLPWVGSWFYPPLSWMSELLFQIAVRIDQSGRFFVVTSPRIRLLIFSLSIILFCVGVSVRK